MITRQEGTTKTKTRTTNQDFNIKDVNKTQHRYIIIALHSTLYFNLYYFSFAFNEIFEIKMGTAF